MASGAGSNALALLEESVFLKNIKITTLIVDRLKAPVIEIVSKKFPFVELKIIEKLKDESRQNHEEKILKNLIEIDWVFLAGYQRILSSTFLSRFNRRIVNIHPSLLPDYPGLNAYERIYNDKYSRVGATVHFVDHGVDTGPIIEQSKILPAQPGETLGDFISRGKESEWKLYRSVLRYLNEFQYLKPKQEVALLETHQKNVMQLFFYRGGDPTLLCDPVDQTLYLSTKKFDRKNDLKVRTFLPGVTDNTGLSVKELILSQSVNSALAWWDDGINNTPVEFNPLIHRIHTFTYSQLQDSELENVHFEVELSGNTTIDNFYLDNLDEEALINLSEENHWSLSSQELIEIKKFYKGRTISQVEIEIIAQTWSEHCKHKIFNAHITHQDVDGKRAINSIFKTCIKKPTDELMKEKSWLISVFSDNAGIVRFSEKVDLCLKVETHNSPSALDPYGGALTGILGVNRDILGTGLGAKPIANLDVFCTGEPLNNFQLPIGLKTSDEILKGIHHGVMDGGNKSGIPTITGAMCFDETYCGKPLVFCGTLGVMPQKIHGIASSSKNQKAGNRIVVAGGAVGLDGIHGATASSRVMDEKTPAGMVQIGDPFTQKRLTDFLLTARDLGLYTSLTDNGAGGLSSSIGEMAELTNGAFVDTSKVPLKYPGLNSWQIMVSESQERMTFSVDPQKVDQFVNLAKEFNVVATDIGEFTSDGFLTISDGSVIVGKLDLEFLHHGLPQMKLESHWKSMPKQTWLEIPQVDRPTDWFDAWINVLSDPTISSKEKWIRQYDHEVQAASATKPFEGLEHTAPNDGAVIALYPHGGDSHEAVSMAVGLAPRVTSFDPFIMAQMSLDEAVRGVVSSGADPEAICLLDNFCWPDPITKNGESSQTLGELVRAAEGIEAYSSKMKMPFISGKDSMKNDFKGKMQTGEDVHIRVLPTMLATALGRINDLSKTCKPHAKPSQYLYLIGNNDYSKDFGFYPQSWKRENSQFEWNLENTFSTYSKVHQAISNKKIKACHDLSEGGLSVALFEMLLLNKCGIKIDFDSILKDTESMQSLFFSEFPSRFLVAVDLNERLDFEVNFKGDYRYIGQTNETSSIQLFLKGYAKSLALSTLEKAWRN